MSKGADVPTELNQTPNTHKIETGVRLRVRRFVVERETAQPDS
ncbi:hypothetical protein MASR1M66_25520 [Aminivibrio sp.]